MNGVTGKAIPLTLFGASMFIAALLALCLPETLNRELPETIPDVENLKRYTLLHLQYLFLTSSLSQNIVIVNGSISRVIHLFSF